MKMINVINDYSKIDSLYRNSERVNNPNEPDQSNDNRTDAVNTKTEYMSSVTREVLSQNELQTLAALFGAKTGSDYTFYGHSEVHQSNAGHILDIRG